MSRRLCTILAPAAIVLLLALSGTAFAMTDAKITMNQETGGLATRFSFEGKLEPGAGLTELDLTFPSDFDLEAARFEIITLEGKVRTSENPDLRVEGQVVKLVFDPPVPPGITVRVLTYDVVPPLQGGTYPFAVTYTTGGQLHEVPGLTFTYKSLSRAEVIARWLDGQAWVKKVNQVKFAYFFLQPQLMVRSVPLLFWGWVLAIGLAVVAYPLAIVLGLGWAFSKMSRFAPLRWFASAYINLIRGTPMFLQIFVVFVGLRIVGLRVNDFVSAVAVLAFSSSAYLAEVFRAGIQSIHKGQIEAALSVGMTYPRAMFFVIIPQTVKRVLPTMTSEFIVLFKDTALLSAVGVFELVLRANSFVARMANLTPFVVAAIYYLLITVPLILWVGRLERRLAISEGGRVSTTGRKRRGALSPDVVRKAE